MDIRESLKKHINFIIKVGALYSSILSFISDIIKPLFHSTLICALVVGSITLLFLCVWGMKFISGSFQKINELFSKETDGCWFIPIFATGLISTAIFLGMYSANKNDPDGYFAAHTETIRSLQRELGITTKHLENISANVESTAKNTADISDNTAKMVEKQDEMIEALKESKNPSDPMAKITQMGLKFNNHDYAQKVSEGDLSTLELFYQGGMNPNLLMEDSTNPIYTAIVKQTQKWREVFRQAVKYGFDPNGDLMINMTNQIGLDLYHLILNKILPENRHLCVNSFMITLEWGKQVELADLGLIIGLAFPYLTGEMADFIRINKLNMGSAVKYRNSIYEAMDACAANLLAKLHKSQEIEDEKQALFQTIKPAECHDLGKYVNDFKHNPYISYRGMELDDLYDDLLAYCVKKTNELSRPNPSSEYVARLDKLIDTAIGKIDGYFAEYKIANEESVQACDVNTFEKYMERYRKSTEICAEFSK